MYMIRENQPKPFGEKELGLFCFFCDATFPYSYGRWRFANFEYTKASSMAESVHFSIVFTIPENQTPSNLDAYKYLYITYLERYYHR